MTLPKFQEMSPLQHQVVEKGICFKCKGKLRSIQTEHSENFDCFQCINKQCLAVYMLPKKENESAKSQN